MDRICRKSAIQQDINQSRGIKWWNQLRKDWDLFLGKQYSRSWRKPFPLTFTRIFNFAQQGFVTQLTAFDLLLCPLFFLPNWKVLTWHLSQHDSEISKFPCFVILYPRLTHKENFKLYWVWNSPASASESAWQITDTFFSSKICLSVSACSSLFSPVPTCLFRAHFHTWWLISALYFTLGKFWWALPHSRHCQASYSEKAIQL